MGEIRRVAVLVGRLSKIWHEYETFHEEHTSLGGPGLCFAGASRMDCRLFTPLCPDAVPV